MVTFSINPLRAGKDAAKHNHNLSILLHMHMYYIHGKYRDKSQPKTFVITIREMQTNVVSHCQGGSIYMYRA